MSALPYTITFTNPQENYDGSGGASAAVEIIGGKLSQKFGVVSGGHLIIRHEIETGAMYGSDSLSSNPVQVNSTLDIVRNSQNWFSARIDEIPYTEVKGGVRIMRLEISGKEAALLNAFVPDTDGNERWTLKTSTFEVGASGYMAMVATDVFGSFVNETIWADPDSVEGNKCYVKDASSPQDTYSGYEDGLGWHAATLPASGTTDIGGGVLFYLEFSTSNQAYPPQGWIYNGTEWFYYEGYDKTGQDTGGGVLQYRIGVRARAVLDTTAATHAVGQTFYCKVAKLLGPEPPQLFSDPLGGTDWKELRFDHDYTVDTEYGCYVLIADSGSASFAGKYFVYDSDKSLDASSTVIYIEDVIAKMASAPQAYGGAGFSLGADTIPSGGIGYSDGDFNLDATGIAITRYDYDPETKEEFAWAAIMQFKNGLAGLASGILEFWFNHTEKNLRLAILTQTVTPAQSFSEPTRKERILSLDKVYSGVRIVYTNDQDPNLIQPANSSHVGVDATPGVEKPDRWRESSENAEDYHNGTNSTDTNAARSNFGNERLVDGRLDTKLKAEIEHAIDDRFIFGDFWFGAGTIPPLVQLDYIGAWINAYRDTENRSYSNENLSYMMRVEGCTDYDTGTNLGTFQTLGRIEGTAYGDTGRNAKTVKLEIKEFTLTTINAIRLVWDYMAGPITAGHFYWAACHQLIVRGNIIRYALVQTTDQASEKTNPSFLYVPNTHRKIRGGLLSSGSAGAPKCFSERIGAASESAAISLGRSFLERSIAADSEQNYTYSQQVATKPELMDTLGMDDNASGSNDYEGILRGMDIELAAEPEFEFAIRDYNASDFV